MLLVIVLALVDIGSAHEEVRCYGRYYDVPIHFTPPLFTSPIYYQQREGGRELVVDDGQSRNKRFSVSIGRIRMKDLTEQDHEGVLLFHKRSRVTLVIEDCQIGESLTYGGSLRWKVPSEAEYQEFSEMSSSGFALKPQVIWNRTDASSGRGTVKNNNYELQNLRQKDSGYYKFMGADGQLIKWKRVEVKERDQHFQHREGDYLRVNFPATPFGLDHIGFTPQGSDNEREYLNRYRMQFYEGQVIIIDLTPEDTGTYTFIDMDGFLALRVNLEVESSELPTWVYIVGAIAIVFFFVICCCCVKKCCCKKSKRRSPATEAAAPPVFYHGSSQPSQPVVPLLSREPRASTADPPVNIPVAANMNFPPSTQVTAPGGMAMSDPDPKYEFKGRVFPSAPPLDSGTSIEHVYTSDKLNFL